MNARSCDASDGDRAGEAVPTRAVTDAIERGERAGPVGRISKKAGERPVQRFVPFALRGGREMRCADGARSRLEARPEPAPQRFRLDGAPTGAQGEQHAAEVVVSRGRETRSEADENFGLVIQGMAH